MSKKKVVLAYSGGLDTSFCIPWLTRENNCEVHAITVNTGGFTAEDVRGKSFSAGGNFI
jgi:argininosuccinate synthase